MTTLRQSVKSMTTNRLQYLIKLCAEEMQSRAREGPPFDHIRGVLCSSTLTRAEAQELKELVDTRVR